MSRKKYVAESADVWSIPKQHIQDFISMANRTTTETNRVRIAVLMTDALMLGGIFRKASEDLNEELFWALCFERDLYAALKDTKFQCKPLPEEESVGFLELASKNWTEQVNIENGLVKQTLNLIEEEVKNEDRRRVSKLDSRESASGMARNKQKATSVLETGIQPSVHKSLKKSEAVRKGPTHEMGEGA